MKRILSVILILIILFSLAACQTSEKPDFVHENHTTQAQYDKTELILGETGELTYFVSESLHPPSSAGVVAQYCMCGDYFYALCVKDLNSKMQKLAESCSLWKYHKDNSFEEVKFVPEGYFIEALCGDDEKTCLLLCKDGKYSFCIIENNVVENIVPIKFSDEGINEFFISFYEGNLLVWKLEGYLQLIDIESGDIIKKIKLGNPDYRFIQMCTTVDAIYAVFFSTKSGLECINIKDLFEGNTTDAITMGADTYYCLMGNSISNSRDILFSDAGGMNIISVETGEKRSLFKWADIGSTGMYPAIQPIITDNHIYIRGESFSIIKLEPKLVPMKERLTYMSNFSGGYINMMLKKFNQNNDKYKIEHVLFDGSNAEKLCTEILAGKAPDILDVSKMPKIAYNNQVLADLTPHIETDEKITPNELYINILNEFKNDDGLFMLPMSFSIMTLAVPNAGDKLIPYSNFAEFEEILKKAGTNTTGNGIEPKMFFESALPVIEKDILIGEQGARKIDKEALIKWFEISEKVINYNISFFEIMRPTDLSEIKSIKNTDDITILGFPGKNSSGCYAKTQFMPFFSILKSSKSKDSAWEFVREILIYKDDYSFTLNKTNSEKKIDDTIRLAKAESLDYTEEDAEILKKLLTNIKIVEKPDTSLRSIILEEAEPYFLGQRELEKTVELIENRANILISEKGL